MATRELKTKIILAGESEYNKKLADINRECRLWQSNLEKVKSAQDGQANSAKALREKIEALRQVQGKLNEKLEAAKAGLSNAEANQKKYAAEVSRTKEKLEQASKRQSELGEVTEETAQEHKKLAEEIEKYRKELEQAESGQKKAEESITNWGIKVNKAETELNSLSQELKENEGYLKEADTSADQCAKSIDEYGKKVKTAAERSDEFGERSSGAVEALAAAMAASGLKNAMEEITEALTECVEASARFETAMAKVGTIANTAAVPMEQLQGQILQVSGEMGIAASEIAEATYGAISASVDTAESVRFVEKAAKLAAGGFTDNATAVDILSTAINAYGLEASAASQVSDYLIMTQNLGKTTVNELASSMGKVIPIAAAYHVEMDNLSAAYSLLTMNGIATAESTTYLKSMLNELGDSGSSVSKILQDKTGSSFGTLMKRGMSLGDIMEILGDSVEGDAGKFNELWSSSEAGVGALSLLNAGAEKYNSVLGKMQDSTGAADKAFEKMADTAEFARARMDTAFENLKVTVGDQLAPAFKKLNETGTELLEWAADFIGEHKEIVPLIGAVAAALGVLTTAVGGYAMATELLIPLITKFGAALSANPIGLAAVAVTTLTAALGTFITLSGGAESEADKLVEKTKELKKAVDETTEEYDAQRAQLQDNAAIQKDMAARLEMLIKTEGRTEAGKKKILELVDQLNANIPELSLAYDEQANSINLTTDAIERMIEAHRTEAEFEGHLEERTELLKKKTEATEDAKEAEEELAKAEAELQDLYESGADTWDQSGNLIDNQRILVMDLKSAYEDATQAVADIEAQISESTEYIEDYTAAQSGLSEETLRYRDSILETAKAQGISGEDYEALREKIIALDEQYIEFVSEQENRIEEIKAQQEELQAAYDETYQNVRENLDNEMELFRTMSIEADQSIQDLIKSLDSQIAYMDNYAENIKRAMELGVDQGLIAKLSDGSEESAKILQAIVNDGGEHVGELNEKLRMVEKGKEAFSGQVAQMQTNFSESWNAMQSELSRNITEMNRAEETYQAGLDTVEGYIRGSASQKGRLAAVYEGLAAMAIAAAKRKLNQHSPSKEFEEIGANNVEGDIRGAEKKRKRLEAVYADTAQAAIGAYEGKAEEMAREIEEKQYVSYTSTADIQNISYANKIENPAGGPAAVQGEETGELLQVCLSYLPYLEQMAQTYGQIYMDPRKTSGVLAPFMNRDLMALRR
ncbi:MAG: phage tail tape measure protein [Lachnospiraceae bacterium]|jgi:TP901 family phage tail tape measure protein|nr:phage tail tape measure protein [Lachnospiraceae bacterium]